MAIGICPACPRETVGISEARKPREADGALRHLPTVRVGQNVCEQPLIEDIV